MRKNNTWREKKNRRLNREREISLRNRNKSRCSRRWQQKVERSQEIRARSKMLEEPVTVLKSTSTFLLSLQKLLRMMMITCL